jgi:hypothetical protein
VPVAPVMGVVHVVLTVEVQYIHWSLVLVAPVQAPGVRVSV